MKMKSEYFVKASLLGIVLLCSVWISLAQYVWRDVYSADATSYAIRSDGTLWSCGWNDEDQLGYTTTTDRSSEWRSMSEDHDWIMMAGSRGTSFFLKSNGTLWTVGAASKGVSGVGDGKKNRVLTQIGTDSDWAYVASSHFWGNNGFAIKKDGTLWGWGDNSYKQLIVSNKVVIVPTQIGTDNDWVKVVSGENNAIGLKKDGTLWAWGSNFNKNLGLPKGSPKIIKTPTQIGTDSDWRDVVILSRRTYAFKRDGSVWGCGSNNGNFLFGEEDPDAAETIEGFTKLNIGASLVTIEGYGNGAVVGYGLNGEMNQIKIWGINEDGFLGDDKGVIFQGSYENIPWTSTPITPLLPEGKKYKKITAGEAYVIVITTDGEMYAWGRNKGGQLGDGTDVSLLATAFRKSPTLIPCPQEKIGNYEPTSVAFGIQSFAKYINQRPDALMSDLQGACIDPVKREYRVTFYDRSFVLTVHLDEKGLIDQLSLTPDPSDKQLEDWIEFVSKSEVDKTEWGNFLGTRFQGTSSGVKKTIKETLEFVRGANLADYRITATFNPLSGVYFIPEIAHGTISYQMIRSYYPFVLDELTGLLGYDYESLYNENYYISYKMKAWGLSYIYFAYARDKENNIFNLTATESKDGGKVSSIDVYLNEDDNKDVEKSTNIWIHHAKLLTQSNTDYKLYATDVFGNITKTFETLDDAIKFLRTDQRKSGITLTCIKGVAQVSWVINSKNTYAAIIYTPANAALSFDLSNGESLSMEVYANGDLSVDWGDGVQHPVKSGMISGKLLGEGVKLYGDITSLDCSSAKVKSLSCRADKMKELACSGNQLTQLELNGMTLLESLDCENNQITALKLNSATSLKKLLCGGNKISKLNLEKLAGLQRLSCGDNQLEELDLSHSKNLLNLNCANNRLTEITLADNMPLVQLNASNNQIESLTLEQLSQLQRLNLSQNKLTALDLRHNTALESLNLSNNSLTQLQMDKMEQIQEFIVSNNKLQSIDYALIPNVMRLDLGNNQISSYDMTNNLKLRDLSTYDNEMSAEAFDKLSTSLYSRAGEVEGHIYLMSNKKLTTPHLTKDGLQKLQDKNWKLYRVEMQPDGGVVEHELTDKEIQPLLTAILAPTRQEIRMYPNPASDYVYLTGVTRGTEIRIVSLDGSTCLTTMSESDDLVAIDIRSLSEGTYLIIINHTSKVLQVSPAN
ncbi:T9SS type A sorting domain-containing protein [Porphyromonas uenonis]|uniref:T9SS type A sorting domain-containing protein n=1 Tax=Porphyromonas uenonis TaxID=281920 RepID=UPI002672A82A|nr:T9SS type A sorting domain-containing protein [Porphyromonas uenonis]